MPALRRSAAGVGICLFFRKAAATAEALRALIAKAKEAAQGQAPASFGGYGGGTYWHALP